jgi:membrane-associated phospholipid phosphatase
VIRLELLMELLADFAAWVVATTRRWPLAAWLVHTLLFCALSFLLLDKPLALFFKAHLTGNAEGFFKVVTNLGEGGIWLIPGGLAWGGLAFAAHRAIYGDVEARLRHYRDAAAYFFLSVALSGIFVNAVKAVIGRYRPRALFDQGLYGFHPFSTDWAINSFPSGHSQAAFAAMTALVFIVPRYRLTWLALALLVAVSRVVTSVHYLSDVAMGSYIGIVGAVLLHRVFLAKGYEVRL